MADKNDQISPGGCGGCGYGGRSGMEDGGF